MSGRFLKRKLFSEFQEINALKDGHQNNLNLHGENIVKSDLSLKLSIEDIINLDPTKTERFVFKLNTCKNKQPKYLQMKVKEYFSHDKKIKLLQIVDVTHHILYYEYKAKH